jgi:hypothetical protein
LGLGVLGQRFWDSASERKDHSDDHSRDKPPPSNVGLYQATHSSLTSQSQWLFVAKWHTNMFPVERISSFDSAQDRELVER